MQALAKYPQSSSAYRKAWADSGLTQGEIADRAGVSYDHFKRILAGKNRPYPALRDRLAQVMNVNPETLPSTIDAPFRGRHGS